jgi:hypothetical protein
MPNTNYVVHFEQLNGTFEVSGVTNATAQKTVNGFQALVSNFTASQVDATTWRYIAFLPDEVTTSFVPNGLRKVFTGSASTSNEGAVFTIAAETLKGATKLDFVVGVGGTQTCTTLMVPLDELSATSKKFGIAWDYSGGDYTLYGQFNISKAATGVVTVGVGSLYFTPKYTNTKTVSGWVLSVYADNLGRLPLSGDELYTLTKILKIADLPANGIVYLNKSLTDYTPFEVNYRGGNRQINGFGRCNTSLTGYSRSSAVHTGVVTTPNMYVVGYVVISGARYPALFVGESIGDDCLVEFSIPKSLGVVDITDIKYLTGKTAADVVSMKAGYISLAFA